MYHFLKTVDENGISAIPEAMEHASYAPVEDALAVYHFLKEVDRNGLYAAVAQMSAPPFQKAMGVYEFVKDVDTNGLGAALSHSSIPPVEKADSVCSSVPVPCVPPQACAQPCLCPLMVERYVQLRPHSLGTPASLSICLYAF